MLSSSEIFALFAELSVGLIGFAGVAAAISGRDRKLTQLGQFRLSGIVVLSTTVLAGCLAFFYVSSSGTGPQDSFRGAALTSLVFVLAYAGRTAPAALRTARNAGSFSAAWAIYAGLISIAIQIGLLLMAALQPTDPSAVIAAFSIQLLHAIWTFWRLLTLPS